MFHVFVMIYVLLTGLPSNPSGPCEENRKLREIMKRQQCKVSFAGSELFDKRPVFSRKQGRSTVLMRKLMWPLSRELQTS